LILLMEFVEHGRLVDFLSDYFVNCTRRYKASIDEESSAWTVKKEKVVENRVDVPPKSDAPTQRLESSSSNYAGRRISFVVRRESIRLSTELDVSSLQLDEAPLSPTFFNSGNKLTKQRHDRDDSVFGEEYAEEPTTSVEHSESGFDKPKLSPSFDSVLKRIHAVVAREQSPISNETSPKSEHDLESIDSSEAWTLIRRQLSHTDRRRWRWPTRTRLPDTVVQCWLADLIVSVAGVHEYGLVIG
jgi:hypothetical protein